jgi:ribulose-phosphate 3-epimerase
MSEIIPAILPKDFDDLEEKLGMVAGFVPMVHIDATDGTLTPGSSWPYKGEVSNFLRIAEEAEGFPYWEELGFEAHLMVERPEEIIEDWIKAGAERLIVHQEAFEDRELSRFLSHVKNRFDAGSSYLGIEIGLAINLNTPIEDILSHVLEADFIHLMSIEEIGVQGNPFNEKVFDTIQRIKEVYPDTIISVDGGVNLEIAEELKERGANRIVVGSAIFGQEDPEVALFEFLRLNV